MRDIPGCHARDSRARKVSIPVSPVIPSASIPLPFVSYLPARVGNLATGLANCSQRITISNASNEGHKNAQPKQKTRAADEPFKLITSLMVSSQINDGFRLGGQRGKGTKLGNDLEGFEEGREREREREEEEKNKGGRSVQG